MLRRATFLPLILATALVACDDGTSPPATGEITVRLHDAPGDVLEAWVVITGMQLIPGGEGEEEGSPVGLTLLSDPTIVDLVQLQDGNFETLVDGQTVLAGTYGQIRLIVPHACLVVEGEGGNTTYASSNEIAELLEGQTTECAESPADGTLVMPSLAETGIKAVVPGGVTVDSDPSVLFLDFVVSESFGQLAGGSGGWVMDPVIRPAEES